MPVAGSPRNGTPTASTPNTPGTPTTPSNRSKNRLAYSDANLISQHDYTHDGIGNRQTHAEKVGATTTTTYKYVYDELNRLTEIRNNSPSTLASTPTSNLLCRSSNASRITSQRCPITKSFCHASENI